MNYQELKALTAGRLYFPWKRSFRQDNWNYWFREIGGAVAKRARAFDMDVLYTGPHRKEEKEREIGAKYVDLDTLLENADFITINAAYNPDLHHLIDSEQFKQMKSTAYLVNAGRGPIVTNKHLYKRLKIKKSKALP